MGAAQPSKRGRVVNSLVPYADFKRRAAQPAVEEINEKSDILVGFSEIKAKGSKAVESLAFTIMSKSSSAEVELMSLFSSPQMQLSLSEDPDEEERLIGDVKVKYGLSHVQAEKVRHYVRSKGLLSCGKKMAVVDWEPRPNVARTLLAALRDDWQLPVKSGSGKPKAATLIPINDDIPISDEMRRMHAVEFAKLKESLRAS